MNEINQNNDNENNTNSKNINSDNYISKFSEKGLWAKITKHYKKAGKRLIEIAITLYYSLRDSDTPKWAKIKIIGALGYFILPVDIVPDFVPIAGYVDDIAVITVALATVAIYIKDEHKNKAKQILLNIFK